METKNEYIITEGKYFGNFPLVMSSPSFILSSQWTFERFVLRLGSGSNWLRIMPKSTVSR
jgi:hypothetical protein